MQSDDTMVGVKWTGKTWEKGQRRHPSHPLPTAFIEQGADLKISNEPGIATAAALLLVAFDACLVILNITFSI